MGYQTTMTELEAVNVILTSCGKNPVSSLTAANTNADAEAALAELRQTSFDLQKNGRTFNTEEDWTLTPSDDGTISLPSGTLKVRTSAKDAWRRLVDRGGKLYSKTDHTFAIGESVVVTLVIHLDYADLPASARWLVAVRASRRFAVKRLGTTSAARLTQDDELRALADFEQDEAENDNRTLAQASPHVRKMTRR